MAWLHLVSVSSSIKRGRVGYVTLRCTVQHRDGIIAHIRTRRRLAYRRTAPEQKPGWSLSGVSHLWTCTKPREHVQIPSTPSSACECARSLGVFQTVPVQRVPVAVPGSEVVCFLAREIVPCLFQTGLSAGEFPRSNPQPVPGALARSDLAILGSRVLRPHRCATPCPACHASSCCPTGPCLLLRQRSRFPGA